MIFSFADAAQHVVRAIKFSHQFNTIFWAVWPNLAWGASGSLYQNVNDFVDSDCTQGTVDKAIDALMETTAGISIEYDKDACNWEGEEIHFIYTNLI